MSKSRRKEERKENFNHKKCNCKLIALKNFFSLLVGSFRNDELLTGIRNGNAKMSIFYPIVFGTTCVFACYSGVTIAVKKFIGYKKDKNLVKNITIMIDDKGEPVLK